MSTFFPKLRRIPDDRALIKDMVERLAKIQANQNRPESDEVDFIRLSRRDDDKMILMDGTPRVEVTTRAKIFTLPMEPDFEFLTAWYKFDEVALAGVARDYSGFSNHAIIPSTVLTSGLDNNPISIFGINEGAFRFDGTSDYLTAPDSESLQMVKDTVGFSVSVWFKPHKLDFLGSAQFPIVRRICCKTDDSANGFTIAITPSQTILFGVKTSRAYGRYFFASTPVGSLPTLNRWYHLVCTFDNGTDITVTDRIRIYLDNVECATPTAYQVALNTDLMLDLFIGARDPFVDNPPPFDVGDVSGFFGGEMDDLRFYKNKILSKALVVGGVAGTVGTTHRFLYGVIRFPVGRSSKVIYGAEGLPLAVPVALDEVANLYTNRRTITTLVGFSPNSGVAMVGHTYMFVKESYTLLSFSRQSFNIQT